MISEATEELMRAHWYQAIPEQYRNTGKDRRSGTRHISSAIIAPPPPRCLMDRFFASIRMHLTEKQLKAKLAHGNRVMVHKPFVPPPSKRRRNKPSLASVPAEI